MPSLLGLLLVLSSVLTEIVAQSLHRELANAFSLNRNNTIFRRTLPVNNETPKDIATGFGYYGGSIVTDTDRNVYLIYYGNWSQEERSLIENLINGIASTSLFDVVRKYFERDWYGSSRIRYRNYPSKNLRMELKKAITDPVYSHGTVLANTANSGDGISRLISSKIASGELPLDENGIYIVLTDSKSKDEGYCSRYCGWHYYSSFRSTTFLTAYIGKVPSSDCPCVWNGGFGTPNGAAMDGLLSTLTHELIETFTDPFRQSWRTSSFVEAADICSWQLLGLQFDSGSYHNMVIGPHKYLVQGIFDAFRGKCTIGNDVFINIVNRDGNRCVTSQPKGSSIFTNGLSTCEDSVDQQWRFLAAGSAYKILSSSGHCMDLSSNTSGRTFVVGFEMCIEGAPTQNWDYTELGQLKNQATLQCIEFDRNSGSMIASPCTSSLNQKFYFN